MLSGSVIHIWITSPLSNVVASPPVHHNLTNVIIKPANVCKRRGQKDWWITAHLPRPGDMRRIRLRENHLASAMISALTAASSSLSLMNVLTTWHPTKQRMGYSGCSGYTAQETDIRVKVSSSLSVYTLTDLFRRPQVLHSATSYIHTQCPSTTQMRPQPS